VQAVATVVAGQALVVLHVDRCAPLLGEPDERCLVEDVLRVSRARPVAGFAPELLALVPGVLPEDLRMQRLAEMLVLLAVALEAARLANVVGGIDGRLR
jgi:hypothetical protein